MSDSYFGENAIDYLSDLLSRLNPSKILLIRGKNSFELSGAGAVISKIKKTNDYEIIEFFDFLENPRQEDLDIGLKLFEEYHIDLILAIGGGSVLDMSKLIRFFNAYQGTIENGFVQNKDLIPLIAMPTTSGTGSEVTRFAVLYRDGVKYSIDHEKILPEYSIVYPSFTYKNPKYLTACTGFDALAQAIEAYWNVNSNEESDFFALKAIGLLWENLPISVNEQTILSRWCVSEGAHLAGKAINITRTTAPHAFSYPLTSYYNYPHGHAVAITFPFFFEINCLKLGHLSLSINEEIYTNKINFLLKQLGVINLDIKNYFYDYIQKLGININVKNIDVNKILNNVNIDRLGNNPVVITEEISLTILNNLLRNQI